ncbi:MAG: glycosyltransferase, partial [Sphingomonadaceae bacterium]
GRVDDVRAWMRRASLLVAVGDREGHPNAVLEAALEGTPLLLLDTPAFRELFDDRSALFVPSRAPGTLQAAILSAMDDATTRKCRTGPARAVAARFTVQAMVDAYLDLYDAVLRQQEARFRR